MILKKALWVFIIIGLLISGYLAGIKLTQEPLIMQLFGIPPQTTVCVTGGGFDCSTVQGSIYSRFMGIPIDYFGFGMYISLALLLALENRFVFLQENGKLIMFAIALFAWVYSMYLVYLQVVVLRGLCQWCLLHELNMTILFVMMSYRLWRYFTGYIEPQAQLRVK